MDEIKKCPTCGETPDTVSDYAFCRVCDADFTGSYWMHPINIWQTRPIEDGLNAEITKLRAELEQEREKHEQLEEKLHQIKTWCLAYPLDVFPEPDWVAARAALAEKGITLDVVTGGAMRHVVNGIAEIIGDVEPPEAQE